MGLSVVDRRGFEPPTSGSYFLGVIPSLEQQVVVHHGRGSLGLIRVEAPAFPLVFLYQIADPLVVADLYACPFLQSITSV